MNGRVENNSCWDMCLFSFEACASFDWVSYMTGGGIAANERRNKFTFVPKLLHDNQYEVLRAKLLLNF